MKFTDLGLKTELLQALASQNYTDATAIQAEAIPEVLAGRDVLAGAQTGTGKTAAFSLPLLQRLSDSERRGPAPRALVLTPTRELASQVHDSIKSYGANLRLRSTVIFGGVGYGPQINTLKRGVDIVIATPGRLLDHLNSGNIDLSKIETLVLDEADRMLDMGFIHDIRKLIAALPSQRQNLMFSATYSKDIEKLADSLLTKPSRIQVTPQNAAAETIEQKVYAVAKPGKRHVLEHLIKSEQWYQVLVFMRTKHGANRLAEQLDKAGIRSAAIHGNKSQTARTRALDGFKRGKLNVLVATDIAARGIDIDQLSHVVNFDLPMVPEDYVHRIGRTGRNGAQGAAVSLVEPNESRLLADIEKVLGKRIDLADLPDAVNDHAVTLPPPSAIKGRNPAGSKAGGGGQRRGGQNKRGGGGRNANARGRGQGEGRARNGAGRNSNRRGGQRRAAGGSR